MGLLGHPEWCGATCLDARAPEVPSLAKMTKMPLVNLRLIEGQTRSKPSQNNTFHSLTSNPSFSKIFGNLDQVWPSWPEVDSRWALETLILIRPLERVETNVIVEIIKLSIQRLFMGWNQS